MNPWGFIKQPWCYCPSFSYTEPLFTPLLKPPSWFPPHPPLYSALFLLSSHFPRSLYTVLVSVPVPSCVLTSEDLEGGTADKHVAFVSLGLGYCTHYNLRWVCLFTCKCCDFSLQLNSTPLCICSTF